MITAPVTRPKLNRDRVRHGVFGLWMLWHTMLLLAAPHTPWFTGTPKITGAELVLGLASIGANVVAAKRLRVGALGAGLYAAFLGSVTHQYEHLNPTTPLIYYGLAIMATMKAAFVYLDGAE